MSHEPWLQGRNRGEHLRSRNPNNYCFHLTDCYSFIFFAFLRPCLDILSLSYTGGGRSSYAYMCYIEGAGQRNYYHFVWPYLSYDGNHLPKNRPTKYVSTIPHSLLISFGPDSVIITCLTLLQCSRTTDTWNCNVLVWCAVCVCSSSLVPQFVFEFRVVAFSFLLFSSHFVGHILCAPAIFYEMRLTQYFRS